MTFRQTIKRRLCLFGASGFFPRSFARFLVIRLGLSHD
jgi:hypothetical protein